MTRSAFVIATFGLAFGGLALTPPDSTPRVPARLPGKGLAQHEFMYTGESHERRIFIVRHGEIVWTYDDPAGKGEISDAVVEWQHTVRTSIWRRRDNPGQESGLELRRAGRQRDSCSSGFVFHSLTQLPITVFPLDNRQACWRVENL